MLGSGYGTGVDGVSDKLDNSCKGGGGEELRNCAGFWELEQSR